MKYLIHLLIYAFTSWSSSYGLPPASDGESLGILVMGSIVSRNQTKRGNVALIKELKSGRVRAVKKGYKVLNRFQVKDITNKYIIIGNSSEGDKLVYQDKFSSEFRRATPITPPAVAPRGSAFLSQRSSYREDGFERNQNNINMTEAYRNKLLGKELSSILMQATAEAHKVNGRIVGFKMYQIDPTSIYDKAGIRDGDIITSINGRSLNSIPGAIKILKNMKTSNQIQFNVLRGGSPQTIRMNVN